MWALLPVEALFSGKVLSHGAVYHHYNKWSKSGEWKSMWVRLLDKHRNELDMSSVDLDGADALKGSGVKVLVDGGIRSGVDVFKALALGADGVLICRPFVTAVYGGGEEGVKCYIDKIAGELADTMQMCGAHSISEITREMVRI